MHASRQWLLPPPVPRRSEPGNDLAHDAAAEGQHADHEEGCNPDNPAWIAAAVKGTNNISMDTLMKTGLSPDAIIKTDDLDGDGDPDRIVIKLEIMELNGRSPDFPGIIPTFDIAPGIQPGAWVFAPKTSGMSTENFEASEPILFCVFHLQ